jgi:arylsulfatase A-like enzyme
MKTRLAVLTLMLGACFHASGADKVRPNIVVLVADDWGFSDVGSFGSEIATPHIDALARNGVRFSNFHVAASCAPTRSMLLTGVDNHRNGVGNLKETMPQEHQGKPGYQGSLNANVVTVATLLQDSGYRTYIAGKWNVGSERYNLPDQRGFDRSIVQGDTGSDNWDPAQRYLPHSAKVDWFEDGREAVMPKEYYSSQYFVDRTIDYLRSGAKDGKPFFAYVGFQANHVPLQAPREFIDKYKGKYKDGWTALREARRNKAAELGLIPPGTPMVRVNTTRDWNALSDKDKLYEQRRMEVYAGMADAMDFHVGRLIAHLKQTGEYDNTVFVFLSDNGPEGSDYAEAQLWVRTQYTQDIDKLGGQGAYGVMGPSWASAAASPLGTYKFYAGEGGIRTPLIISGVAGVRANQVQQSLTHVTDIVPTLLELAQVPLPGNRYKNQTIEPVAGTSLVPLLQGRTPWAHPATQAIGYELSGNLALFKGDMKLVKNLPPVGDGLWHLHDLRKDPGETTDLQTQMPELFKTLQSDYEIYAKAHGVLPIPDGYSPTKQVFLNSMAHYWLPTYGAKAFLLLCAGIAAAVLLIARKRKPQP